MLEKTISEVVNNALCTACGACAGLCPVSAIQLKSNPAGFLRAYIDSEKCIQCSKCLRVCPSYPENSERFSKIDLFRGVCLNGYIGYASDEVIRRKSQSGGVVTALLCYLLEKQEIDGAIVTSLNEKTIRPEAVFVSSIESIIDSCGSYYAQSSVVKTILENKNKKTAAVVLGCQAESLNIISQMDPTIKMPKYTIGLICGGQNSGYMIDDLIQQTGYDLNDKDRFRFRFRFRFKCPEKSGGWPGDIYLSASNKEYILPKERRHLLKKVYESHRCLYCYDKMNAFCDIVCGDPWGIAKNQLSDGYTVLIARTENGKKLLDKAKEDGVIVLENLPIKDILNGQSIERELKPRFYALQELSCENNKPYPYQNKLLSTIPHIKMGFFDKNKLRRRLEYTRVYYMEEDSIECKKIVVNKKKMLSRLDILINIRHAILGNLGKFYRHNKHE